MNRRDLLRASGAAFAAASFAAADASPQSSDRPVERWGVFEAAFEGPKTGNPYIENWVKGVFRQNAREVIVDGFYDGYGAYKLRFMPDTVGRWTYVTESNVAALKGKTGAFEAIAPIPGNHGPVSVRDLYHFGYADGTPYFEFGTTCYAWVHQTPELQQQTLATLKASPFNKIRMCIFPKWYAYNHADPPIWPFPREGNTNDYTQFNPEYFRHIEKRVSDLQALGIEADLILFHPYDHWGFQEMPPDVDDRYLRYLLARFAAFRNVWWSLANEYDLMRKKTAADWDRFAKIVTGYDPYSHLRSIHYSKAPYDYGRRWCTHAGVQDVAFSKANEWRESYGKPVIFDEMQYEGNLSQRWGNLSGEEMTRRFWLCIVAGVYPGHGETYIPKGITDNDQTVIWWSHGGTLKGTSPSRIAFLRKIAEETASLGGGQMGLQQIDNPYYPAAKRPHDEAFLFYTDYHQPMYYDFPLPEKGKYRGELIDPWEMTVTPIQGVFSGKSRVDLTGKPYQAIRFVRL
jgi:hypothetical protein